MSNATLVSPASAPSAPSTPAKESASAKLARLGAAVETAYAAMVKASDADTCSTYVDALDSIRNSYAEFEPDGRAVNAKGTGFNARTIIAYYTGTVATRAEVRKSFRKIAKSLRAE